MDDFHHGTKPDGPASAVIEQLRGKQQQHGTNAFAPASPQILADLGDCLDARNRIPPELTLNGREILAQQLEVSLPLMVAGVLKLFS